MNQAEKQANIKRLLAGLDKNSAYYQRSKDFLENLPFPGLEQTSRCGHIAGKNVGLYRTVTYEKGVCPCAVCGHRFIWECEEANCQCCSSVCT